MTDLEIYFENTQKPWGKLFYRMLFKQLSFARELRILDFGSGFGITANHMATNNTVVAVEPNKQMCEMSFRENTYTLMNGDVKLLNEFSDKSFDLIICHNVFEYIKDKNSHMASFSRLLKASGKLSLVKHNHLGRIMQIAVHDNNIEMAIKLLNGEPSISQNFGEINYYNLSDIDKWIKEYGYKLIDNLGVRAFFGLNPNDAVKYSESWLDSMFEIESMTSQVKEFRNIAFYNHIILEKI